MRINPKATPEVLCRRFIMWAFIAFTLQSYISESPSQARTLSPSHRLGRPTGKRPGLSAIRESLCDKPYSRDIARLGYESDLQVHQPPHREPGYGTSNKAGSQRCTATSAGSLIREAHDTLCSLPSSQVRARR